MIHNQKEKNPQLGNNTQPSKTKTLIWNALLEYLNYIKN